MLKPSELYAGTVVDAQPMTLVLPRDQYEFRALVFEMNNIKLGLLLSGRGDGGFDSTYHIVNCRNENDWNGVLIPGVEIELDPSSLTNAGGHYPPKGSLIREKDVLAVQTAYLDSQLAHQRPLPIVSGLPVCAINQRACFTKWQIVLGQGLEKRVLHTVDVTGNLQ